MSEEKVDILDEQGEKTGQIATRSEVHSNGLWHEVIHVWAVNDKSEVLTQKRSNKKSTYKGLRTISVTGGVSSAEDADATAARETQEELGQNVGPDELIKLGRLKVSQLIPETALPDNEFVSIYLLIRNINLSTIKVQAEEVTSVEYCLLDTLEQIILDPVRSRDFIRHPPSYYLTAIDWIKHRVGSEPE